MFVLLSARLPTLPGGDRTAPGGGSRSPLFWDSLRSSEAYFLLSTLSESGQNFRDDISVSLITFSFFFLSHFALGLEIWLGDLMSKYKGFSFISMGTKALKTLPERPWASRSEWTHESVVLGQCSPILAFLKLSHPLERF